MSPLLKLQNAGISYHTLQGEIPALSHISFTLNQGDFISFVGPSGCGKSTLLNLIAGLIQPETGNITMNGMPLEQSGISIGYMLQKDHLFEWRTVYENVILGLEIQGKLTDEKIQLVDDLLESYGLAAFKTAHPSQLSGGMRQRAALIRTLALEPSLLLLDEPFSALDYQTRLRVSDEIGTIIRKEKKSAILVTHDISEAVSMSDRVIVLTRSPATIQCQVPIPHEISQGTPMEARNSPEFKTYFNKIWKEMNPDA